MLRSEPKSSRAAFVLARLALERGDVARARKLVGITLAELEKWPNQAPLRLREVREFLAQIERGRPPARK